MALLPTSLDYTDKDFDSILSRLRKLISSVFPEWTDAQVANFGNLLVEMFAWVGDVLTFYQDNQAAESRIATATQRKNLIALAKLLAYEARTASAATVDETFTLGAPAIGVVTLPRGTIVKTREITNPIKYQLLADLVFSTGQSTQIATVENSAFQSSTFVSTGVADQGFVLPATPYLDGSAEVSDALDTPYDEDTNPDGWKEVDNFLDSDSTDKHFSITVDQNDRATITFGNGVNGVIPSGTISVSYKTGGGKTGRVEAGKLTRIEGSFTDSGSGLPVTIACTNALGSSGGDDRESNEQIRVNAPASLRLLTRAVAREDFEIAALTLPSVARALHLTKNEFVSIPENQGILFIVPAGGGAPSSALLTQVAALFAKTGPYPKTVTYGLAVNPAPYKTIDVSARIFLRPGVSPTTVKANVLAALTSYFAIQNADGTANELIDFGYYYQLETGIPSGFLPYSDVYNAVRDATGVARIDPSDDGFLLNGVRADPVISTAEFPVLGTVTLINGLTGVAL